LFAASISFGNDGEQRRTPEGSAGDPVSRLSRRGHGRDAGLGPDSFTLSKAGFGCAMDATLRRWGSATVRFGFRPQLHEGAETDAHHLWSPVAGLVPGTHVFAVRSVERKEGVDAHGSSPWAEGPRAKPGQGDRGLCWELEKQPISLNPTAVVGERESHSHFYKPFSPRASS
jgi:hypothetical protein